MPPKRPETTQIAVRLQEDLLAKVDAYTEQLQKQQPGLSPRRADAIRVLLILGLEAAGKQRKG